jgi:hypothetical protein
MTRDLAMTVLVAAATRHGSTQEIAEAIGRSGAGSTSTGSASRSAVMHAVGARHGDDRDWGAISEWARGIALALRS